MIYLVTYHLPTQAKLVALDTHPYQPSKEGPPIWGLPRVYGTLRDFLGKKKKSSYVIPLNSKQPWETKIKINENLPNSGRPWSYSLYFKPPSESADGIMGKLAAASEVCKFLPESALQTLSL